MTDIIIQALASNIDGAFVFNEKIHQGYDENCFIVTLSSGKHVAHIKNSYINYYDFIITYYCKSNHETYATAIFDALKLISDTKIIKTSFKTDDDSLIFSVSLRDFTLYKSSDDKSNMQNLYFK